MKLLCNNGITAAILRVKIIDSGSAVGAGKTGLTHATAGLLISTIADNEATAVTYSSGASTIETISTLGTYATPTSGKCRFKEVHATNHPGLYEIQLPNARLAVAQARSLIITVSGVSGAMAVDAEVQLASVDLNDGVRAGLTALPNVASGSAGALPTTGTGANQIEVNGSGAISQVISVAACQNLLEADRVIDTSVTPWALVLIKRGSGALGAPGTIELLRQSLGDVNGAAVTSINTILGRSIT